MKTAIVKTGGKQYLVREGAFVKVEKLPAKVGEKVQFNEVLLAATEQTTKVGTPTVAGASVEAKVTAQSRARKVFGIKMKPKKRYRRLFGHRQDYTQVEITKIKTR
jgi:large subunit ribosomal protein L21